MLDVDVYDHVDDSTADELTPKQRCRQVKRLYKEHQMNVTRAASCGHRPRLLTKIDVKAMDTEHIANMMEAGATTEEYFACVHTPVKDWRRIPDALADVNKQNWKQEEHGK